MGICWYFPDCFFLLLHFVRRKIFSNSKLRKHGIYAGTLLISALLAFDQSNGKSILIFWIGMAKYILILSLIFVIINQLKKRNTFGSKSIKQYLTFTIVIFTVGVVSELISLPVILQLLKSIDSNSYHQYFIENTEKEQFIYWSSFSLAYLIYIVLKPLKSKAEEYDKTIKDQISTSSSLASIQSRVNPHFLYNALNSIASLAHTEPQKTEEMALELARFYEKCTDKKADLLIPLRDELSILDSYLKIEKIRFGDRLQVSLPTDEDIMDYLVPSFILQPIVENAIKYGYHSHENFIKIRISASTESDILTIRIYDSGPPFSENLQSGYGLDSIHKKLKFLFPDRHSISFVNQPEKCVEIVLYQKTNII
ncbi:MAG: histidine kinase [Saprospiraceae bacterium]|nr:histidine kinase [Saprospiraceae bacterium]